MNAPQVMMADIHAKIIGSCYTLLDDGRTTICQIELENGYTVIGKSACVCAENYNQALGEKYAFEDAVNAIWPLEGYLLAERLSNASSRSSLTGKIATVVQHDAAYQHRMDQIAKVCHEVNRAYCQSLGDTSQPSWEDAPEWQRASARMGVDLHLTGDFGPEASHISWMKQKLDDGWQYGPFKDAELKQHPCIMPFNGLPREQQAKDYIFRAIVHAFK